MFAGDKRPFLRLSPKFERKKNWKANNKSNRPQYHKLYSVFHQSHSDRWLDSSQLFEANDTSY